MTRDKFLRIGAVYEIVNMQGEFNRFNSLQYLSEPVVQAIEKMMNELTDKEWKINNTPALMRKTILSNDLAILVSGIIDNEDLINLGNCLINEIKRVNSLYSDRLEAELELIDCNLIKTSIDSPALH